jgi:hypothetical protein
MTGEGQAMSVETALRTLAESMRREDALRARTEGLTWMVWGMAFLPLVLVWPAALYLLGDVPLWANFALLPPWILLGAVASYAVWRTAALAETSLAERRQAGWRVVLGYLGVLLAISLVGSVLAFAGLLPYTHPDVIAMCYAGLVWMVTGAWNPFGLSATGRRVSVVVGAIAFVVAVALIPVLGAMARPDANALAPLAALLTLGGLPFAAGAWQALRG